MYTALFLAVLVAILRMALLTPFIVSMRAPGSVLQRVQGLMPDIRRNANWGVPVAHDKEDDDRQNVSSSQSSPRDTLSEKHEMHASMMEDEASGDVERLHLWRTFENMDDVAILDKAASDLLHQVYSVFKRVWSDDQLSAKDDKGAKVNLLKPGLILLEDAIVGFLAPLSFRFLSLLLSNDKELLERVAKSLEIEIVKRTQYWCAVWCRDT